MDDPISKSEYHPAARPELDPHHVHRVLMDEAPRTLAYRPDRDRDTWRAKLLAALASCLGEEPSPVALDPAWDAPQHHENYLVRRVEFSTERHVRAAGWLVTPPGVTAPRPTVICLQGHSTGAHISLGEPRHPGDEELIAGDRDYAMQAVARGYNAFALDQRTFGTRMDSRPPELRHHYDYANPFTDERCRHQAMVALLLGRTLLGERIFDVRRALDLLQTLPEVDGTRIACVGNSGGGTVTYYAACMDERIAAAMPGCSVCSYAESIGSHDHCSDNYLPGALRYFDMGDLAALIAPRPLVVVASDDDPIFPYTGVTAQAAVIEDIYRATGAETETTAEQAGPKHAAGSFELFTGSGGHRFFADAWSAFDRVTGW